MQVRSGMKRPLQDIDFPLAKRSGKGAINKSNVLSDRSNIMLQSPPVTPEKERVIDISHELNSNKEGVRQLKFLTPPSTPTKGRGTSVYSKAKALFQRSANNDGINTTHLTARDEEAEILNKFLVDNINNNTSDSLYISGPPGTGKTAQIEISLNHVMKEIGKSVSVNVSQVGLHRARLVKMNCMSISKPENVFHEIYCAMESREGQPKKSYNKRKTADDVFLLLTTKGDIDTTILLLDEMDYLITKDQQVLFQLFNFASKQKSHILKNKLVLIGISNALDLTDKFLPRLKRNCLNPQALQFMPYTSDQIKTIIITKLKSLVWDESTKENEPPMASIPIIHPAAIQLCCKKSASVTGDLRKAFDICYKSIEMVEHNVREANPSATHTFHTAPKVLISHIAKICENSYKDNSLTKLHNLNLLQKAVLCCLFNYQINVTFTTTTRKDLTVNTFYDFYVKHSLENVDKLLGRLKKGEFLEIIGALEAGSVVNLSETKSMKTSMEIGNKNIRPNVPYDDLLKSIGDIGVLKKVLHGNN
ncbi:uncharacterized protein AC631_03267 [Debaryomyces fabryi]|uniref:Cell division control protein n=1 Tax=Debaryomyces fabryi TaxID=58627 RepID=A0A0V1PXG6_9ASCO|nr:uncharacterized protein AC631_03267 [Debaryomyces fabryi]KSA00957.1 hypothetical protein AC631_03267 [Debaryomyces fabryi]CUM49795.1 unnamed protein product [Debaryomyces fabryi]